MQTISSLMLGGVDDISTLEEWTRKLYNHSGVDKFVVDRNDPDGMFVTGIDVAEFNNAVAGVLSDLGLSRAKATEQNMLPVIEDGSSVAMALGTTKTLISFGKAAGVTTTSNEGGFVATAKSLKPTSALETIGAIAGPVVTFVGIKQNNMPARNVGIAMMLAYVGWRITR